MRHMLTRGRILFALLAAIAVVMAGIVWGLTSEEGPSASAQAVVRNACDQVEGSGSFDIRATVTAPTWGHDPTGTGEETWELNVRVSGEDFHMTATMNANATLEVIGLDGVTYGREPGGEWKTQDIIQLPYVHSLLGFNKSEGSVICPELGPVARVREGMLGSVPTRRFRLTEATSLGPFANVDVASSSNSGYKVDQTWDFWVDPSGQLVQTKVVMVGPTVDDQSEPSRAEFLSVISGVGEPNVIVAPDVANKTSTSSP